MSRAGKKEVGEAVDMGWFLSWWVMSWDKCTVVGVGREGLSVECVSDLGVLRWRCADPHPSPLPEGEGTVSGGR